MAYSPDVERALIAVRNEIERLKAEVERQREEFIRQTLSDGNKIATMQPVFDAAVAWHRLATRPVETWRDRRRELESTLHHEVFVYRKASCRSTAQRVDESYGDMMQSLADNPTTNTGTGATDGD